MSAHGADKFANNFGANRTVLALSVARLGDAVGNSILFIVIPLYVVKLPAPMFPIPETVLVGLLISLYGLTNAFLQPFVGAWIDRVSRRKPFILDLRSNPGGLLSEAVGTASQFLEVGNVLLEEDAQGEITPVPVLEGGLAPNLPLVVLIDPGTASAAEIVSGALQDAGRAKLVGETTFGTGTVLNEFSLSDGSALLLATEEWLTPKGRLIWHQGIAPDVQVTLPQGTNPLLPEAEAEMTLEQVQNSGDAQLLRALEQLNQSADGQSAQ